MKFVLFALLFSATFAVAQDNTPGVATPDNSKHEKNWVTVQGCVSRASGDYVLIKTDPANTFELQASGKIHLHDYLGQRVEITGPKSATLSSSSDTLNRTGSASPVTISVKSIKTINKECPSL
jgi:hypothetical protein